ncbi:uncharacterized protein LOC129398635 [Pan paniscus]|uniref:uncharacterized protein LOC129398635 n=1 Tax=Pan paniscus TaxID=9597 RepID=UPI00243735B8|nr:uncharacterized protein LOC129398635 [Pan paniscus]
MNALTHARTTMEEKQRIKQPRFLLISCVTWAFFAPLHGHFWRKANQLYLSTAKAKYGSKEGWTSKPCHSFKSCRVFSLTANASEQSCLGTSREVLSHWLVNSFHAFNPQAYRDRTILKGGSGSAVRKSCCAQTLVQPSSPQVSRGVPGSCPLDPALSALSLPQWSWNADIQARAELIEKEAMWSVAAAGGRHGDSTGLCMEEYKVVLGSSKDRPPQGSEGAACRL